MPCNMDEAEFWSKRGTGGVARRTDNVCPRCKERPRVSGDSYCQTCRRLVQREWMRANRIGYADLPEQEKLKNRCRAYTRVLVARGKIEKGPCSVCGGTHLVEAHHPDYRNPRLVIWKCRPCHRREHREQRLNG